MLSAVEVNVTGTAAALLTPVPPVTLVTTVLDGITPANDAELSTVTVPPVALS